MNWTQIEGNWNEAKGRAKSKWGKLTDDDLMHVEGKRDRLLGVIQQRYGLARDKAEEQVNDFMASSEGWMAKAKEQVTDAVNQARENVTQAVEKGKQYFQEHNMSEMATDMRDLVSRYPVQSAIIGVGIGFLIGRMFSASSSNRS